jgi:hypothetical protein
LSDSLAFHVVSPDGGEALVLLVERGAGPGVLRCTEWQAGAYHLPGQAGETSLQELRRRIDRWHREGWRFSENVPRITGWLDQL